MDSHKTLLLIGTYPSPLFQKLALFSSLGPLACPTNRVKSSSNTTKKIMQFLITTYRFLWMSTTRFDSFLPSFSTPRSILLNNWTSAFLFKKINNLTQLEFQFMRESSKQSIYPPKLILPVGRNCFPVPQKTAVTFHCPCHVTRVWWNENITFHRHNVV